MAKILIVDGEAALHRFQADAPCAVLLDLRMPVLGGMEALEKIRQLSPGGAGDHAHRLSDVPTVVEAMRRGADDFVTKPFDANGLLLAVRHALGRRAGGPEEGSGRAGRGRV